MDNMVFFFFFKLDGHGAIKQNDNKQRRKRKIRSHISELNTEHNLTQDINLQKRKSRNQF